MDIIFDIDGTLADCQHRRHFVEKPEGEKDWDSFYEAMSVDPPIVPVVKLAQNLWQYLVVYGCASDGTIIICSGRPNNYRQKTIDWLKEHNIEYDALYMRKEGDRRPDDVVKQELLNQIRLDGYNPQLVIDDRKRVVDMRRKNGIITLQCAEGDF